MLLVMGIFHSPFNSTFLYVLTFLHFTRRIFGRTLSLILENIENYLLNCYDVVGLLIMIKVSFWTHDIAVC